jgi:hypothetical protein
MPGPKTKTETRTPLTRMMTPSFLPTAAPFWQAQDGILDEAESYSRDWFRRRHEAAQSAIDAAREIGRSGTGDATGAARVMADWQRASAERLAEDMRGWFDFCSRCAEHVAEAQMEAGKEGMEAAGEELSAATKTRHATPV